MKDDTQNLLNGIGQPGFQYRSFDAADEADLFAKWPMLGLMAASSEVRDTPIGRPQSVRSAHDGTPPRAGAARGEGWARLLSAYDEATPAPAATPGTNVRSLLGRLAEERR